MNIPKYLSAQGVMSRREAESFIERGLITVNGLKIKNPAHKIDPTKDHVEVSPIGLGELNKKITVAYHKPRGVTSEIIDGLNSVGRLDKESEGLLLLSNDGLITKAVTSTEHLIEKEYNVTVREKVMPVHIRLLETGIRLNDGMTLPCKATRTSSHSFTIILKEGRKHQIRRMAEELHLNVTSLKRIRIGNIHIGNLRVGAKRELSNKELVALSQLSKGI